MQASPTTSVVVVTRDPEQQVWLARCLSFLLAGSVSPDQVVVVVDEHPPLARLLTRQIYDLRVTVVESRGIGWAEARNTGLAYAWGDIVAFVEDDSSVGEKWLYRLVDALRDDRVAVAAGHAEARYAPGVRPLPGEILWLVGADHSGWRADGGSTDQILGTGTAFRRTALVDAGGFRAGRAPDANALLLRHIAGDGHHAAVYVPAATVGQFIPEQKTRWSRLARSAWQYGRPPVPATGLYRTAFRHLGRGELREAAQCVLVGLAVALGYRLRHL